MFSTDEPLKDWNLTCRLSVCLFRHMILILLLFGHVGYLHRQHFSRKTMPYVLCLLQTSCPSLGRVQGDHMVINCRIVVQPEVDVFFFFLSFFLIKLQMLSIKAMSNAPSTLCYYFHSKEFLIKFWSKNVKNRWRR